MCTLTSPTPHHCAPGTELGLSWKLRHMLPLTSTPLGDTPNHNSSPNPPLSSRTLSSLYPQRNVESCTKSSFSSHRLNYLLKLQNYTPFHPTNKPLVSKAHLLIFYFVHLNSGPNYLGFYCLAPFSVHSWLPLGSVRFWLSMDDIAYLLRLTHLHPYFTDLKIKTQVGHTYTKQRSKTPRVLPYLYLFKCNHFLISI